MTISLAQGPPILNAQFYQCSFLGRGNQQYLNSSSICIVIICEIDHWKVYQDGGELCGDALMDLERDLSNLASFMAPYTLTQLRSKVDEMRHAKAKARLASRGLFQLKSKNKPAASTYADDAQPVVRKGPIFTEPLVKDEEQSVILKNLTSQTISIPHASISVVLENLNDCTISIGPAKTSVVLQDCRGCKFQVAGQQIRARNLQNCEIALWSPTGIVVESSTGCHYLPYDFQYDRLPEDLTRCGFSEGENRWNEVNDFDSPLA
jgi:hypothetical protein